MGRLQWTYRKSIRERLGKNPMHVEEEAYKAWFTLAHKGEVTQMQNIKLCRCLCQQSEQHNIMT